MLKLVRLNNIIHKDNVVVDVDSEFICDVPDDFDEDAVLGIRDEIDDGDDSIFVLWRIEDDLVTCENVLLGDFIDIAEWDFRVISAVAADELGMRFEI